MRKPLATLVIVALTLALFGGAACAVFSKKPQTGPQIAAVSIQALDVLKAAGDVAVSVRTFERDLASRGVVTPAQSATFEAAFAKTQAAADKAIAGVRDGSLALRSATRQILDTVNDLVIAGQSGLAALIESLKAILSLGQSIPVPLGA